MTRSIIVGNGINIQFGGMRNTNKEIIKRALINISKDRYTKALSP